MTSARPEAIFVGAPQASICDALKSYSKVCGVLLEGRCIETRERGTGSSGSLWWKTRSLFRLWMGLVFTQRNVRIILLLGLAMCKSHLSELQVILLLVGPNLRNMFSRDIMGSSFSADDCMDMGHMDSMDQIHININPHTHNHQQPKRINGLALGTMFEL